METEVVYTTDVPLTEEGLRYDCTDPAFAGCFVVFDSVWSRRDVRQFWGSVDGDDEKAAWWQLVQSKIVACYLTRTDDLPPITDPAELTVEALDDLDIRLFAWLDSVAFKVAVDVSALAKKTRQTLYSTSAETNGAGDSPKSS